MEVINDLLAQSLKAGNADEMKALVEEAYKIANGLDPYLDRMISRVPQACQDLIEASASHDWAQAHEQVRCRFNLTDVSFVLQAATNVSNCW